MSWELEARSLSDGGGGYSRGRHSLCMMVGCKWRGQKERYLN